MEYMSEEERASAMELAISMGTLMEGRSEQTILLALGNVMTTFLLRSAEDPEEAAELLREIFSKIDASVRRRFMAQVRSPQKH